MNAQLPETDWKRISGLKTAALKQRVQQRSLAYQKCLYFLLKISKYDKISLCMAAGIK